MTKFNVGVLTVVEVESNDWTDAANIAEGAIHYAIWQASVTTDGAPVVKFHHRNGHNYEGKVVRRPVELERGSHNGYFRLEVAQPRNGMMSDDDSDHADGRDNQPR